MRAVPKCLLDFARPFVWNISWNYAFPYRFPQNLKIIKSQSKTIHYLFFISTHHCAAFSNQGSKNCFEAINWKWKKPSRKTRWMMWHSTLSMCSVSRRQTKVVEPFNPPTIPLHVCLIFRIVQVLNRGANYFFKIIQ